MLRIVGAVAAIAIGATLAYAQNLDIVKQRRAAMKAVGGGAEAVGKMMKGETPFDLATVQKSLATFQEQAAKFKTLFSDDSKIGGDTAALPKIWEARAGFDAAADKFVADSKAAAVAIKDEASLKAEWGKVGANCGGCHKEYRAPPKQ